MTQERKQIVKEFFAMLKQVDHSPKALSLVKEFFYSIISIKSFVPPTMEFFTIFRSYKPLLYQEFKDSLATNSRIYLLMNISFDLTAAMRSLGIESEEELHKLLS